MAQHFAEWSDGSTKSYTPWSTQLSGTINSHIPKRSANKLAHKLLADIHSTALGSISR